MTQRLSIGQVARRSAMGIETVRYYERRGLLAKPQRKPSGYRQYDHTVIARLQFIRRAKDLGFTLAEIGGLLNLWFDSKTPCSQVRQKAEQKIADIETRIAILQNMKHSLRKLIRLCQKRNSIEACPLLEGLDGARP